MSNPNPYGPNPYNPNPQGNNPNNPQHGAPRQGGPQYGMPPYNGSQRGQYGQQYGPYGQYGQSGQSGQYGQYGQPRRPEPPRMPQMQPNLPYGRPPRKPRRTIGGGGIAAIIVSVLLVPILLFVLLFGGGLIFYSKKIDEATADGGSQIDENKPKAGSIDVWYNISERPDYEKTVDYIHKLAKETKQAVADDEKGFLKNNNLPYNRNNREYVETYVKMLQAYDEYTAKDSELNSVDIQELDDMISYRKIQVEQIVEQFNKHEHLGAKTVATDEDGGKRDVYTDTRTNMRKAWDEHEQQVAQYQYNGNDWIGAAKEAARLAGMEIDWNIYNADKVCTPQDYTYVQALYCPMTPNLIYANSNQSHWDTAYALATIKHEIAHHAIHMRCGTLSPPVVMSGRTNRTEAVTSSYAIMFLGADSEQLNMVRGDQYRFDDESNAMAAKIHNNQCKVE
ncbi:hypothetical protein [Bifidobacterium sp.]|uniref:hypothetical protein n=1 Tax=Bifidobacterium sp. TaxID=41200 RepID=UPI003D7CA989